MAKHTHSDRLERWLGKEHVERVSREFKDFYWPVAVHGVPGNVHVMPGGDFTGEIKAGQYFTKEDSAAVVMRKILNLASAKAHRSKALASLADIIKAEDRVALSVGAFASIDAVIQNATNGNGLLLPFYKDIAATHSGVGSCADVWQGSGSPGAGDTASAAPGGTVPTSATTGALKYINPVTSNTGRYLNWVQTSAPGTVEGRSLLLYDRLFAVAKTMNSTGTEAVTGVPTRYQSQTTTDADYIGGNFCFPSVTANTNATSHVWTTCQYTNDTNTTGKSFQSTAAMAVAVAVSEVDLPVYNWFLPLAAGDVGVKALTQMQCSALVTGGVDFVIGHPIAVNACITANVASLNDGLLTALSLTPILDNACLTFLGLPQMVATSNTRISGYVRTVSE